MADAGHILMINFINFFFFINFYVGLKIIVWYMLLILLNNFKSNHVESAKQVIKVRETGCVTSKVIRKWI